MNPQAKSDVEAAEEFAAQNLGPKDRHERSPLTGFFASGITVAVTEPNGIFAWIVPFAIAGILYWEQVAYESKWQKIMKEKLEQSKQG